MCTTGGAIRAREDRLMPTSSQTAQSPKQRLGWKEICGYSHADQAQHEWREFIIFTCSLSYYMAQFSTREKEPVLSDAAFWDIDRNKLDVNRYADFTIIRIFERGTPNDIEEILRYYDKERIIHSLRHAASLKPRAVALGMKLFGLTTDDFACSKPSQRARHFSMY